MLGNWLFEPIRKALLDIEVQRLPESSSDEAIEFVLRTPKTTLRRWVEKAGYQWKVGAMEVPYRFKSLRGNEAVPFS